MNTKAPQNMQVTPDALDHRETVMSKPPKAADELAAARAELEALRARIVDAGQLQPLPAERHCLDCFRRGRDAAIRAILGK